MKPMFRLQKTLIVSAGVVLLAATAFAAGEPSKFGLFDVHRDIGTVAKPGALAYNPVAGTYLITGGGDNIWNTNDAFHYVWKQMSGDLAFSADISWPATGGNPHRKACLMIRQTLDPQSPYADVAVHGVGLTSIQYREEPGGQTREVQASLTAPGRVRIEKRGDYVSLFTGEAGGEAKPAGGVFRITFKEPFYVGLAVCAHDDKVTEQALFSKVELAPLAATAGMRTNIESTIEIVPIQSKDRRIVHHTTGRMEAANWTPDNRFLIFNKDGRLYRLPPDGKGAPEVIDTGFAVHSNNDHGISPDGKWLAISDSTKPGGSRIYMLPIEGGTPRLITPLASSYWHGWSPDGKLLAFCGQRGAEFDVYTIPTEGGEEKRLTTAPGKDDGPEYSPDGKFIYFNSERTGNMQIWRMKPDGSEQEQVTDDEYSNWFAHPSPDGRWLAVLSYAKDVHDHPENKDVILRLMPVGGGAVQVLAKLFGGQGTINVPSWSPDSKNVAFVSYQFVYH